MHTNRSTSHLLSAVVAGAMLCAAVDAAGQAVHRQVDAEGNVSFSDRPEPAVTPQAAGSAAHNVAKALAGNTAISSRGAANVNRNEAARRLQRAQQARRHGALPLPGEQTLVAGKSEPNYRYWQRQERLRRVVEQAQRRSNETAQAPAQVARR